MKINVQIELPDEFLSSITPRMIASRLSDDGFKKHSEHPGKHEIWKHLPTENRFMVCTDITISDYVRTVCEVFHLICRYTGIKFLSLIQDFGWGLCRTCINGSGRYSEAGWFGECKHYPETEIMGDFGCTEYKFKGVENA